MTMDAHAHSLPAVNEEHQGLSPAAEKTVSWGTSGLLHVGGALLLLAACYAMARPAQRDPEILIPTAPLQDGDSKGWLGRGNDPDKQPLQDLIKNVPHPGADIYGSLNSRDLKLTGLKGVDDSASREIAATFGGGSKYGVSGSNLDGNGLGALAQYGPPTDGGTIFGDSMRTRGRGARKIVFVLDHSGSMLDTFDFLRQEVHRVVGGLSAMQHFGVVMYSEGVTVLGPERLQRALPEAKVEMLARLDRIRASGENDDLLEPFQVAVRKALAMEPELIIFLTDGKFDERLPGLVKEMNKGKKVVINTIAFVKIEPSSEMGLRQIARESGGKYKFVSEQDLK